ncbi:MFS transporter [Paenibacillus sp. GCM10023248]|uniref:MFS transporter n=1 Tax=Bacillales TaxID=1385 RepID=UPI002378229B|nr:MULTISPECIES: MFS transporter [Bacillales]MDD9266729.1 MFS transporter [Paenibacillus sp. MAHUQ-63]MDR6883674.1 DHA1 family multidrug resistance protein-like MFS transporter [Bacillus sp. 3255]
MPAPLHWKKSLWILWGANFSIMCGMNLILPFLPLYVEELGVHDVGEIVRWTGWIVAAQFITSFLTQPLWGAIADRRGRKIMLLRAGFGMAVVTALMGIVTDPWQLLALRLLNGFFSGFISMAVSLQASLTPAEHSGKSLGTLQTGSIAGSLIGPLVGGLLASIIGYSHVFFITGALMLCASLIVMIFIREERKAPAPKKTKQRTEWRLFRPLLPVFAASLIMQVGMMSIEPIVTVYAKNIYTGSHLELLSGLVVAITGIANLFGAPSLGRLGDRIGQRKTLVIALCMAALAFIPQAFATGITMLLVGRFLLGLFIGGMIPSLNVLVRKLAPTQIQGTAYGFNTSSLFLGNLLGPLLGSHLAAEFGFRSVFIVTMSILLLSAVFVYFNRSLEGSRTAPT